MRRTKHVMKMVMVFALIISLFVACANNDVSNNVKVDTPKTDNTAVEETDTKKDEVAAVDPNAPGWQSDTSPITLSWYLNFSWFPAKWGTDPTSKYITEKTGVNIDFVVPAGNENEKLNTMIASGTLPDLITLGWWEQGVKSMIAGDLVLPLNQLAEEYDPYFFQVADSDKINWYKQEDGNTYGYPNASSSPKDIAKYGHLHSSNQTFVVRKDMYEAIGSPDMRTQEGFLSALKLAKEKFPQVNGQPIIPLGLHEFTENGNYSLGGYIQNFLAIPLEKDGQLYDRSTDPLYVSWLKTFRQANQDGLLSKDIFIDKRPQMEEKIAQGRYFAMLYQRSDFASQQGELFANDPNSIYIAVDGPANPNMDPPQLSGPGIAGWTVTLISKDVKDKARAIKFLSYLISEEGQKDTFLGEKGYSWDTIDGKDQFKPEVIDLMNKDRGAFDKEYGSSNTYWMLMDNNMSMQWAPPTADPFKQMEDWTKGKIVSLSKFDNIDPTADSEEGIALTKNNLLWGKTLPKLVLAKSEADFDKYFAGYVEQANANGKEKITAFMQVKFEENIKKLAGE